MAELKLPPIDTLEGWREWRHRGRTNLLFLCIHILGYTDVDPKVHGLLCRNLQRFDGGYDRHPARSTPKGFIVGTVKDGTGYKSVLKMQTMKGHRKTLNLISRGHLKTTIATISHTIQWIINYPDVRILLSSGTDSQVKKFLDEIKKHFQFNERFRYFYPEFCPQGNVKEFGNQEQFTVPCRTLHRKEPTVSTVTVGSIMAGGHYDVIKHDDVVDKENVRTFDQMAVVESHIQMTGPLLERYNAEPGHPDVPAHGWVDFIGTRYHFSDLYGKIIAHENKRKEEMADKYVPEYSILELAAVKDGKGLFDPKAEPLWPQRFPIEELRRIYHDPLEGGSLFSSQYMMRPTTDADGLIEDEKQIVYIPKKVIDRLYAGMSLYVAIDLAGMENNKNADTDYTVLTLAGFDRSGCMYPLEVIHGRPNPFEVINFMFDLWKRHPRIRHFKIEKENHARVLLPFLKQEMEKRGIWLPILAIPRDNQTSKTAKIKGLQPWFKTGRIRFSDAIPCKDVIKEELIRFPKWHDDFLDTLRDLMDDGEGGITSEVQGRPRESAGLSAGQHKFLGFSKGQEIWADGGISDAAPTGGEGSMVGCL